MGKRSIGQVAVVCVCAVMPLSACDDREDAATEGDAEPLVFEVGGTLCGNEISYRAPADAKLTLLTTPSGRLQALVVADGPLVPSNDPLVMRAYAEDHDVFASFSLEESVELGSGAPLVSSVRVMARDLGSLELNALSQGPLEITEYEPGKRIAGSITGTIDWFTEVYPEWIRDECMEGEVTVSFRGGFETWDGQQDCFSPTQNLDRIESDLILGCECDPASDEAVCVTVCEDPTRQSGLDAGCDGMAIALFCSDEQWSWGYDGPCRL
jgi:hypothetical protein